jgi:hypothetical protein
MDIFDPLPTMFQLQTLGQSPYRVDADQNAIVNGEYKRV